MPGLKPRPFDREAFLNDTRARVKKAMLVGGIGFLFIALVSGPTATLVLALLLGLALYTPAWEHVPFGRVVVLTAVIAIVFLYPFYQPDMFELPIFGSFPTVDTAVTMPSS